MSSVQRRQPPVRATRLFDAGCSLAGTKAFSSAIAKFEAAIEICPDGAATHTYHFQLGRILEDRDYRTPPDYSAAIEHYTRALSLAPDFHLANHRRARCWYELHVRYRLTSEVSPAKTQSALDKALKDFARCVELNPDFRIAFLDRANLYTESADRFFGGSTDPYELAINDLRAAKSLSATAHSRTELSNQIARVQQLQSSHQLRQKQQQTLSATTPTAAAAAAAAAATDSKQSGPAPKSAVGVRSAESSADEKAAAARAKFIADVLAESETYADSITAQIESLPPPPHPPPPPPPPRPITAVKPQTPDAKRTDPVPVPVATKPTPTPTAVVASVAAVGVAADDDSALDAALAEFDVDSVIASAKRKRSPFSPLSVEPNLFSSPPRLPASAEPEPKKLKPTPPPTAAAATEEIPRTPEVRTTIQVRMPSGNRMKQDFNASDSLWAVYSWIQSAVGVKSSAFTLVSAGFPKRQFDLHVPSSNGNASGGGGGGGGSDSASVQSLKSLGLVNASLLLVLK